MVKSLKLHTLIATFPHSEPPQDVVLCFPGPIVVIMGCYVTPTGILQNLTLAELNLNFSLEFAQLCLRHLRQAI